MGALSARDQYLDLLQKAQNKEQEALVELQSGHEQISSLQAEVLVFDTMHSSRY